MTISINNSAPAQIAPQDLNNSQSAPSGQAGDASTIVNTTAEASSAQSDLITAHAGLVALANATAPSGVGNLVNPDLNGEGARLQALQLKQQLGAQSISIANQAPQALLSLLRQPG